MAAGVPLVASNVHGILDYVIDGKTGYAVKPNDVDGFALAIKELAQKQIRESMVKNCIESVKRFEKKNALDTMFNIYLETLHGK